MEDLPQEFFVEITSINMEFLENKTGEITAETYLISISEILNGVQQIRAGSLLIASNYILGLIRGNSSIYLFDFHSKDEKTTYRILAPHFF